MKHHYLTTGVRNCSGELFLKAFASVHDNITTETAIIHTPKHTPNENQTRAKVGWYLPHRKKQRLNFVVYHLT